MRKAKKKSNATAYISPIIVRDELLRGAILLENAERIQIAVYVDGQFHAKIGSQFPVSSVYQKLLDAPQGAMGFVSPLPSHVFDGASHEIIVRQCGTGEDMQDSAVSAATVVPLLESRLVFRHGDSHGKVSIADRHIKGWIAFQCRPTQLPVLTLKDRQDNVVKQIVLIPVPTEKGHPDRYMARFRIPLEDLPLPLHVYCGESELSGSPCGLQKRMVGFLDKFNGSMFHGWAFDWYQPASPVELLLKIDGRIVQYFRPNIRRPDVAKHLKTEESELGIVGFNIAPPGSLFDGEEHRIDVEFTGGGGPLHGSGQIVRIPKAYLSFEDFMPLPEQKRRLKALERPQNPTVSIIILNRNGESLLAAFLESWKKHNSFRNIELIVVDHASEDASLELLASWQSKIPIHIISLSFNDSFSASCNRAANEARGQFLLFLNNDIVWLQDALPEMVGMLKRDSQLGVLGIKLIKSAADGEISFQMSVVQHLGVRFTLNGAAYWPYEITPEDDECEHSSQTVPVVTGAVMLCRKQDFFDAGQFDTNYFYGFEDVEFCLRLSHRLNKKIICRNDLLALHHHGYTRLSGRVEDVVDRLQNNSDVLQKSAGLWLKRHYWKSLIQGDGYVTVDKLTIGIVIDGMQSDNKLTGLQADAGKLAKQLRKRYPAARVVFLPPRLGWYNARGIHILLVGHPEYDIQMITSHRQDLITVAWVRNDIDRWALMPWWMLFDAYLAPQSDVFQQLTTYVSGKVLLGGAESPLGTLLHNHLPPLRVVLATTPDMQAEMIDCARLRQSLKSEGVIVWEEATGTPHNSRRVADVVIAVCRVKDLSRFDLNAQSHTLNILWIPDSGKQSCENNQSNLTGWRIVHQMPCMEWLQSEIEIALGNTFHSS